MIKFLVTINTDIVFLVDANSPHDAIDRAYHNLDIANIPQLSHFDTQCSSVEYVDEEDEDND